MFHSALSVHDYLSTSTQNTRETADIGGTDDGSRHGGNDRAPWTEYKNPRALMLL